MNRRNALGLLGTGLLGLAWEGNTPSRLAAWTTPRSGPLPAPIDPLGIQLYTLRGRMAEGVEATLDLVARIGYREVEFAGYFQRTPAQIRSSLTASGLSAPSAHVSLEAVEQEATLAAAAEIGHQWLVVPSLPSNVRQTLNDWARLGERFTRIARTARSWGLRIAYHNHDTELRPFDGEVPLEVFLAASDPALVHLQADLFWLAQGGVDPVDFLNRWPGRVPMVHVKDRGPNGEMVDIGTGTLDWRAVLRAAPAAGIRHWFVEHDNPKNAEAFTRSAHSYLAGLQAP